MIVKMVIQNESKKRRKEKSTRNVAVNQKISTVPVVLEVRDKISTGNTKSIRNEISTRNIEND